MSKSHGGYSRTARKRRKIAALLSQQMRRGDGDAAFRLLQRRRALQGIAKHGWALRVHAMNVARYQKREQRMERPWTLETPQMARVRQAAELQMRLAERVTLESKLAAERAHKQAPKELEARQQGQLLWRS